MNNLLSSLFSRSRKLAVILPISFLAASALAQTTTQPTLVQVSVGFDNTTYGLMSDRSIVVLHNDSWTRIDGQLVQISVGAYHNVWGVNQYHNLFRLTENGWVSLPGQYQSVSASGDNAAVALDFVGNVSMWDPDKQSLYPLPAVQGGFTKVAIGRKDRIYALNGSGKVSKYMPQTQSWRQLARGTYKDLTVTFDGLVSVRDYQNVPFVRTDGSVNQEIQSNQPTTAQDFQINTALMPATTYSLASPPIPSSATKSFAITPLGEPIQFTGSVTVESFPPNSDPTLTIVNASPDNAAIVVSSGCLTLNGNLSLTNNTLAPQTQKTTLIVPRGGCIQGTFKKIPISGSNGNLYNTSFSQNFAISAAEVNAAQIAEAQRTSNLAPCAADSHSYAAHSDETFVRFTLPAMTAGSQVHVVAGAQNKYVFPKCNRVYWDNLTFACQKGQWKLIQGRFGADGACTGWAGPSEFYQVGFKGDASW